MLSLSFPRLLEKIINTSKASNKLDIILVSIIKDFVRYHLELLREIPIDPQIVEACDSGKPYIQEFVDSEAAKRFHQSILPLINLT